MDLSRDLTKKGKYLKFTILQRATAPVALTEGAKQRLAGSTGGERCGNPPQRFPGNRSILVSKLPNYTVFYSICLLGNEMPMF